MTRRVTWEAFLLRRRREQNALGALAREASIGPASRYATTPARLVKRVPAMEPLVSAWMRVNGRTTEKHD